jgi:hypothetical protein
MKSVMIEIMMIKMVSVPYLAQKEGQTSIMFVSSWRGEGFSSIMGLYLGVGLEK